MKNRNGIREEAQDQAPDRGIEVLGNGDIAEIRPDERHVAEPERRDAFSRARDVVCIPFDANDCARRADEPRRDHSDVPDAGTDVEHTLACADAGVA